MPRTQGRWSNVELPREADTASHMGDADGAVDAQCKCKAVEGTAGSSEVGGVNHGSVKNQ